jgi:Leucine-rich repeat (LRR) protein
MSNLEKIKQLFATEDPENATIAFYLLVHFEERVDAELANYIMQGAGYLEHCIRLKCRAVYPYIDKASVFNLQQSSEESAEFWAEFALLQNLKKVTLYNVGNSPDWAAALAHLPLLSTLTLSKNGLQDLPADLGKLHSLQTLTIHEEPISQLPEFLLRFGELQNLSVRYCRLNRLPDWLVQLQELSTLVLSDNLISEIPISIGFLPKLRHLDLSNNKIGKLPATLRQLQQLKHLYISNNSLSTQEKNQWYTALPDTLIL